MKLPRSQGHKEYSLLDRIENPSDLRQLTDKDLPLLAQQLRDFLIDSVGKTGGHLSAGLGTIELTIALHYIFNTPNDRIVWDVGHQSYPHKILTERKHLMPTLRQKGGLSGFPKRDESPYDTFGVGHSSTSISAALGMAIAAKAQQSERRTVAVIGDGAMTAGMAFEALNHAGDIDANILVILNDNDMSISPNVGGLSNYLAKILSGKFYSQMREGSKKVLQAVPPVREIARRAEEHVKGMVIPGTLFEELGFNYIGPIDGHDIPTLIATLKNLKELSGPQFLHIVTKKGKGYPPAEKNPCAYHGVSAFDRQTGKQNKTASKGPTYTEVFSQWLCDMAAADQRLVGITPAMREGSGLVEFSQRYPSRYFDVGIAEQHCVTFAAGLACDGLKPIVAIYSTFLQRAYDQLIHDVCIQDLPVVFAVDRAGLVGPDGATHAGSFDISFLRCIPNVILMAPADENECRQMLYTGYQYSGPSIIRYPRGCGPGVEVQKAMTALALGKAQIRNWGEQIVLFAFGSMVAPAEQVGEHFGATVINMRFIKPMDEELVIEMATKHKLIITLEENAVMGGAGSAINDLLASMVDAPTIINLGLPDRFLGQGTREQLLAECGLDVASIINTIGQALSEINPQALPASTNS